MRRLELERGFPVWGEASDGTLSLADEDGVAIHVNGTLRFTVSFENGLTVVALQGEEGPLDWITTLEDEDDA